MDVALGAKPTNPHLTEERAAVLTTKKQPCSASDYLLRERAAVGSKILYGSLVDFRTDASDNQTLE